MPRRRRLPRPQQQPRPPRRWFGSWSKPSCHLSQPWQPGHGQQRCQKLQKFCFQSPPTKTIFDAIFSEEVALLIKILTEIFQTVIQTLKCFEGNWSKSLKVLCGTELFGKFHRSTFFCYRSTRKNTFSHQ